MSLSLVGKGVTVRHPQMLALETEAEKIVTECSRCITNIYLKNVFLKLKENFINSLKGKTPEQAKCKSWSEPRGRR